MDEKLIQYVLVYAPSEKYTLPMVIKNKPDFLKGLLNLPGGKVEVGESPIEAAIRELKEETGLSPCYFPYYLGVIRGAKSEIHVVQCSVYETTLKPEASETEVFNWYSNYDVLKNPILMPNLRLVLPLCFSGHINWKIIDDSDGWRGASHTIKLFMNAQHDDFVEVTVKGMNYAI